MRRYRLIDSRFPRAVVFNTNCFLFRNPFRNRISPRRTRADARSSNVRRSKSSAGEIVVSVVSFVHDNFGYPFVNGLWGCRASRRGQTTTRRRVRRSLPVYNIIHQVRYKYTHLRTYMHTYARSGKRLSTA